MPSIKDLIILLKPERFIGNELSHIENMASIQFNLIINKQQSQEKHIYRPLYLQTDTHLFDHGWSVCGISSHPTGPIH